MRETDVIFTTLVDGNRGLFYLITIAPEDEMQTYQATFEQIVASLRLNE